MPSALLPVAVGPTIATSARPRHQRPANARANASADKRSQHQQQPDLLRSRRSDHDPRVFVIEEGDREERRWSSGYSGGSGSMGLDDASALNDELLNDVHARRTDAPSDP